MGTRKPFSYVKQLSWFVYLVLATILVYPFLAYEYLFAADQYVHGYNACILEELRLNADSYYASWFHVNTFPEPNWIGHGIMWGLAQAVPLYVAEKVFVFLLLFGNGYAFLNARSALSPLLVSTNSVSVWVWKTAAASLSLVFLFGAIWQLGFVNYLLGMVAVIVGLTHTSRLPSDPRFAAIGWGIFTYFCHPIAFLFFMGTFSLRELLGRNLLSVSLIPQPGDWAAFLKRFLMWFGVPIILLGAYIITHSEVSTLKGASPWRLLGLVYHHNEIALFNSIELSYAKLALLVAMLGSFLGGFLLRKKHPARTLAFVGASVLIGAVVLAPDYFAGGAFIHQRLMPFVFVWFFWCSANGFTKQNELDHIVSVRLGILALLFVGISICGLTNYRNVALPRLVEVLDEFREFSKTIPRGSSILPVSSSATSIDDHEQLSLKPVLHHFAANLDCRQEIVLLDNYEAYVKYFPLLWNAGKNPFEVLSSGLEEHPASLNPDSKQWLIENADYILSMGPVSEAFEPGTYRWISNCFGESKTSENKNFHLIKINKEGIEK